jgi:hypothetical protein
MKLESKHLASYLPYGLKIYDVSDETVNNLVTVSNGGLMDYAIDSVLFHQDVCKPILRPLSDLKKGEILINGEFIDFNKELELDKGLAVDINDLNKQK